MRDSSPELLFSALYKFLETLRFCSFSDAIDLNSENITIRSRCVMYVFFIMSEKKQNPKKPKKPTKTEPVSILFSRIHNRIFNLKSADFSLKGSVTKMNFRCNIVPFSNQRRKLHLLNFFFGLSYF